MGGVAAPTTDERDDFEEQEDEIAVDADTDGKRRRVGGSGVEDDNTEAGGREAERREQGRDAKRRRVVTNASEDRPHAFGGYLDPPKDLFPSSTSTGRHARTASGSSFGGPQHATFNFSANGHATRLMPSDPRGYVYGSSQGTPPAASRDSSVEGSEMNASQDSGKEFPPRAATLNIPLSGAASGPSRAGPIARDFSMPPSSAPTSRLGGAPFKMRASASLTPAPTGQGFGPSGSRLIRDPSVPALSTLGKRSSEEPDLRGTGHRRSLSVQPTNLTLGDIQEHHRVCSGSDTSNTYADVMLRLSHL
jgi:hypothetical protein